MVLTRDVVLAHALGERYGLPIPQWLFAVAGAAVVALSFLFVLRRAEPQEPAPGAVDGVPEQAPSTLPGVVSVGFTLFTVLVGLVGTQNPAYNLAPVLFWVLIWIVVPMSCGLLGDWTRAVNPFAVVARLGDDAGLRRTVLARTTPLTWSPRVGWWPAFGLFVALVLGELVYQQDATGPAFVGTALLVYLVASFVLGLLFGPSWLREGEVLSGLFHAWGRLGWFRFGAPGRAGFTGGLDVPFTARTSRIVFILLMLVSINFDGLLATPQWETYQRTVLGGGDSGGVKAFLSLSLLGLVLAALVLFAAFATWSARLGGWPSRPLPALAVLLPSLVPIAYGYLIAHYLSYVVTDLQLLRALVTNPGFGEGNTSFDPNPELLPNSFYWYVSVVVIVAVHVVAVVVAHRRLVAHAPDQRRATISELPWLVAMVGYTAFSLFLIAQSLTESG